MGNLHFVILIFLNFVVGGFFVGFFFLLLLFFKSLLRIFVLKHNIMSYVYNIICNLVLTKTTVLNELY